MAYVRTNWVNDTPPPIDAVNLNNIETGLLDIHTRYDIHDHSPGDPAQVDGGDVINTPAGGIAATDVQAALNELDTEKAGIADTETISGDWTHTGVAIFDALKKGMEIRNADEFTAGSATGGIQEAHDDLPARGGIILVGPRLIDYGTAIEITKPCFLQCAGRGIVSLNPNAGVGASTELRWIGAADAPYMIRFKAPNVNEYYFGGGFQGVTVNGNDLASVGVLLSSTAHTRALDIHGRGSKIAQIKVDGGNGVLSFHNHFDNIHITTGANPATAAAHGIMFDGSVDAPTGTGGALYLDGGGGTEAYCNTFHFVSGDVSAKAGSFGNKILHLSNEGLDFTKFEAGADIFYMLVDYAIGAQWFSRHFQLVDSQSFSPGSFVPVVGVPSTGLWAAQWGAWFLDSGITEGVAVNFRIPVRWRYGRVSFGLTWGISVNAGGNVRWQVVAERGASGSNIATPDFSAAETKVVPANNVTIQRSIIGTFMNVNSGDEILIRVERLGGHGDDTYGSDAVLVSLYVQFYGRLPVNGDETIGPFYPG